jgi:hypothetical protein
VIKEMNELKGAAVSMMDGRMDDALPITPILFFFPTNKKKSSRLVVSGDLPRSIDMDLSSLPLHAPLLPMLFSRPLLFVPSQSNEPEPEGRHSLMEQNNRQYE